MRETVIDIQAQSVRYNSQVEPTLFDVSIKIQKGEKILIAGKSGSGKSTLAHLINGLIPYAIPAVVDGYVRVGGVDAGKSGLMGISKIVGTVLQDPDGQFIGLSVGEDIAFSLENDCAPLGPMREKVAGAAKLVRMEDKLESSPRELSGGQKQRATIAGVLVDDVDILLFDEPLANLDPATGKYAVELIDDLRNETGKTVIIIEHRIEDVLIRRVDRVILIEEVRVICQAPPAEVLLSGVLAQTGVREPLYISALRMAGAALGGGSADFANIDDLREFDAAPFLGGLRAWYGAGAPADPARPSSELLRAEKLRQTYENGVEAIKGVSFIINQGETVALLGRNGAGKSTLANVICGMEKPSAGALFFKGADMSPMSIAERSKKIGYVMQDPNHMISKPMIFDEVALGLRARGVPEPEAREKVIEVLRVCDLYPMRNWPVSALSFGQKKRVTIASVLSLGCEMLILDEPTAGQDYSHYTEIMEFLLNLKAGADLTLLFITHDMHLALEYTERAIVMTDGEIIADRATAEVFGDGSVIGRADLKKTSLSLLAEKAGLPADRFIGRFIQCEREARRG